MAPPTVALEYVRGLPARTLAAGRHRRAWGARYVMVPLRDRLVQLAPQAILTAEQVEVRVNAAFRLRVSDPRAYHEVMEDPEQLVYLAVQVALRDAVAGMPLAAIAGRGGSIPTAEIAAAANETGLRVGIEVLGVTVKDIILPVEVRRAAAQLVAAQAEGLAEIERARASTAALRAAANGAKLLEDHPALAQLRMIEAAPPGSQVVLHVGGPAEA